MKGVIASVYPFLTAYHLDDLGVPSRDEMNRMYGGPERWQTAVTWQWIDDIAHRPDQGLVVVEGQARPSVIIDAAHATSLSPLNITLIDCSPVERRRRPLEDRAHPEVDTLGTYAWAIYLRHQAQALKLEVIDTTSQNKVEAIEALARSIGSFAAETGCEAAQS